MSGTQVTEDEAQRVWRVAKDRGFLAPGPECNELERRVNLHVPGLHELEP